MDLKRSWMFVPGHRQKMIDKALGLNTDAIMLDIEDGVAPSEKDTARQLISEALGQPKAPSSPARFVRINAIGHARMDADLDAVVRPGLEGLVLPKVETAEEVMKVDSILTQRERQTKHAGWRRQASRRYRKPARFAERPGIAGSFARVCGLMFGAEDFGRELGLPTSREGEARDMLYARSAMVIAAASAHVQAVDGVWVDLKDTEGLAAYGRQSRRLGFSAMSLIHPSQIDPINQMFSPTSEEIDYAQRVIQAFEEANARGDGSIAFGGQLIDQTDRRAGAARPGIGQVTRDSWLVCRAKIVRENENVNRD